jgi:hypothetical protein
MFDVSFHPFYPDCDNCCVQCHKIIKNTVPTANALGQGLLASFWMDSFFPKYAPNFKQCIKSQLPLPVESIISCLRKVYHAFHCINDDFGGDYERDCAIIDHVFSWQVRK